MLLHEPPSPNPLTMRQAENVTALSKELVYGWVDQPNTRGTFDILQSCIVTIFLCSYSSLFLNMDAGRKGRAHHTWYKLRWMLFTILAPDATCAMAGLDWLAAKQSVEDFSQLGHPYPRWTMRHAFFANMGGFMLHAPDFPPFPVDCQQIFYLVQNNHLSFPDVEVRTIWDKNKADGFARSVTIIQITWFTVQCIARGTQHLTLTTLEFSTVAFIAATLHTFFFWNHKPLDAEVPIELHTSTHISHILINAGPCAQKPYTSTPLDFAAPKPAKWDIVSLAWAFIRSGNAITFNSRRIDPKPSPTKTFAVTRTKPPRNPPLYSKVWSIAFGMLYYGLYIATWNHHFSTLAERIVWRIAIIMTPGLVLFYFAGCALFIPYPNLLARVLRRKTKAATIFEVIPLLPQWKVVVVIRSIFWLYVFARFYILVESFLSLRELPGDTFDNVQWSNYIRLF